MFGIGWQEAVLSSVFGGCVFLVPIAIVIMLVLILRRLDTVGATLSRIEQMSERRQTPSPPPIGARGGQPTSRSPATGANES